jgi:hypothetical protein
MPRAVSVVEVEPLLGILLSKPERLALREADGGKPRVTGRVMSELEDDVNLFEGTEGSFGIEEVYQGKNSKVGGGEDDPRAVGDALEGDGCDEDNAITMLAVR